MAIRWRTCEECNRLSPAIISWPTFANPLKQVCCECYAVLQASTAWARSTAGNTANCAYGLSPPPTDGRSLPRLPIPAGCEYRYLFQLWRAHRGLREPLRNRIVINWPEGVTGGRPQ